MAGERERRAKVRLASAIVVCGVLLATGSAHGASRGYLTTPAELRGIASKAAQGLEPYATNVAAVMSFADRSWDFTLRATETCESADDPAWNDNGGGNSIVTAKSLAHHLTGDDAYAEEVATILERIMTEVRSITLDVGQCQLNFGWGTPELVAAADLIDDYWKDRTCSGPTSSTYGENSIGTGPCKELFQNWLVKNPYYVVSYSGRNSMSNWGTAATNTMARIADYVANRTDLSLVHRNPPRHEGGRDVALTPVEAWHAANALALDRMNGYGVELGSRYSCDYLGGSQQSSEWDPVKSQITERGIIPEDARRTEFCNVPRYNGSYQNYPQLHLSNNIEQCELMRRRGDVRCFENMAEDDRPNYTFVDRRGDTRTTHLRPGRGSIERAIKAIIVDSGTEWRHTSGLVVAYRYYHGSRRFPGFELWSQHLSRRPGDCSQDICFGTLTHGFAPAEDPPDGGVAPPAPPRLL